MLKSHSALQTRWPLLLASAAAVVCIFLTLKYASQPLLEAHDFRQTQTALSAYWMRAEGWHLDYQTPVVGYPWAIPFEFPIYQILVVGFSNLFKLPMDAAGRIVSAFFLLAIAWPALRIARHFRVGDQVAWIFCALLWSAPLYLFWGRSFMIETAGIFFTMAALSFLFPLTMSKPSYRAAGWACLFGSLALLQKVTTALPAMAVVGVWTFFSYLRRTSVLRISGRQWLCLFVAYAIPLVLMQLWTSHSDAVKSANAFGKTLTSSSLLLWNFGTLKQRLTPSIYFDVFGIRIIHHNLVSVVGVAVIAGALLLAPKVVKGAVLFCLTLGTLPILIFFNLHFCHTYYQAACTIFFIAALAIATVFWLPQLVQKPWWLPLCVFVFVAFNYVIFFGHSYGRLMKSAYTPSNDLTLALCQVVKQAVPAQEAVIVFGKDWSSSVAYYSERKTFTVPDRWCQDGHYWDTTSFRMGDRPVGGVVCLPNACVGLTELLQKPEVKARPVVFSIFGGYLWLPQVRVVKNPMTDQDVYPLPADSLGIAEASKVSALALQTGKDKHSITRQEGTSQKLR